MAYFQLLSFLVSTVIIPQVFTIPSYGGFVPALSGFPGIGYANKPLILTCAVNFTDYYKKDAGIINAIAVTIKEKSGGALGGIKSPLLSYVGYGGLSGSGLTATIDIYSAKGGPVSVAFTERARPERGCFSDDFGPFLTTKSDFGGISIGGLGGYGGYGAGSYGAGGYGAGGYGAGAYGAGAYGAGAYGGYGGLGSYGGFGGSQGLGGIGGLYGPGYGGFGAPIDGTENIPGVIAKVNLSPGTASSINIDSLNGFSYLKELAGRGVIVCPSKSIENGYQGAQCEGGILSCCALHYDQSDSSLTAKYDGY